jgi:uncharacterized membrane protein YbhN (UPF0104 family)
VGRWRRSFARHATARRALAVLLLVALTWALQLVSYHLTALALGLPIALAGSLVALVAVNAGISVSVTPGNVGVVQLVYASTAHALGLPLHDAVGVALVLQAVQTLPVLLVCAALLRRRA